MATSSMPPIMTGSILISGRRSGQVRLDLKGPGNVDFAATSLVTFRDVMADARDKLGSIIASPSPVESEENFLKDWMMNAVIYIENKVLIAEIVAEVREEALSAAHAAASAAEAKLAKQSGESISSRQHTTSHPGH